MAVFMDALLNILAIFGIVVAGGLLLYFVGSFILSIINPEKENIEMKKKEESVKNADNEVLEEKE